jgi:hypothetical protein
MMRLASVLILPACLFLYAMRPNHCTGAEAQRVAITDPAEVDIDFGYQGEYLGTAYLSRGRRGQAGLQVMARGNGRFEATWYLGGFRERAGTGRIEGRSAECWTKGS